MEASSPASDAVLEASALEANGRANHAHHPSGLLSIATIRTKHRVARRAEAWREHLLVWNARSDQLLADTRPPVKVRMIGTWFDPQAGHRRIRSRWCWRRRKPSSSLTVVETSGHKCRDHLRPDLVATRANRGADRHHEICGLRAERAREVVNGFRGHSLHQTPPASVSRRNHALTRIGDEQWHAVRRLHRDGQRGVPRHHDVGLR